MLEWPNYSLFFLFFSVLFLQHSSCKKTSLISYSNSFYMVGQIQPTFILRGPDQWNFLFFVFVYRSLFAHLIAEISYYKKKSSFNSMSQFCCITKKCYSTKWKKSVAKICMMCKTKCVKHCPDCPVIIGLHWSLRQANFVTHFGPYVWHPCFRVTM